MRKPIFLAVFLALIFTAYGGAKAESKLPASGCAVSAGSPNLIQPTPGGPDLQSMDVFPPHGPLCMRYKYQVIYKDREGRPPEYVKIFHNCQTYDMKKAPPTSPEYRGDDYKKGVLYEYEFVPNSTKESFYYFYASNGKGISRAAIIDSPNNGPMIFPDDLTKNKIVLFSKESANPLWEFDTKGDWVSKISISYDGTKIFARTSDGIYYFDKNSNKPLWSYPQGNAASRPHANLNYGTVGDMSSDGKYAAALINNNQLAFFDEKGKILWQADIGAEAIALALSKDGSYIAVGSYTDVLLFKKDSNKPLWRYPIEGNSNVHWIAITPDGEWISATTGCPDRRAYIFNKNSGEPYFRSEQITRDAPVWATDISSDGKTVAFSSDNEQGKTTVFIVDKDKQQILWQHASSEDNNSRTINISSDGRTVAAGTKTNFYLFDSKNPTPLWSFKPDSGRRIYASAMDASGKYLAAGASDGNVYFFSRDSNKPLWTAPMGGWVNAMAMDAAGNYLAAGTGAANYIFDNEQAAGTKTATCSKIIEPPATLTMGGPDGGGPINNLAVGASKTGSPWPIIGGVIVILAIASFLIYWKTKRRLIMIVALVLLVSGLVVIMIGLLRLEAFKNPIAPGSKGVRRASGSEVSPPNSQSEPAPIEPTSGFANEPAPNDIEGRKGPVPSGASYKVDDKICEPAKGEAKENSPKDCTPNEGA